MLNFILNQLQSWFFAFVYFLIGIAVGFIIIILAYYLYSKFAKMKAKKEKDIISVEEIVEEAKNRFLSNNGGNDYLAKVQQALIVFNSLNLDICEEYGVNKDKNHTFCSDFYGGITILTDFSLFEALMFMEELVNTTQKVIEKELNSLEFSLLYKGASLFNKNLRTDPTDLKLSKIYQLLFVKKEAVSLMDKIFKKVINIAVKGGLKLLNPTIVKVLDRIVIELYDELSVNISQLNSGKLHNENLLILKNK